MKFIAIMFGRLIQSGLLFVISIFYMTFADNVIFVKYSYYLAIGSTCSLIILYGGYIEATQISKDSIESRNKALQVCLIIRPLLFWSVFFIGCLLLLKDPQDLGLLISIVSFLSSVAMADIYLFRKQFIKFLTQIIISSLVFILIAHIILSDFNIIFVYALVILDKIIIAIYNNRWKPFLLSAVSFSLKDFFMTFMKPVVGNSWFVLSSVILGIFLGLDRIMLVNNYDESEIRQYIVALTMTTPINFFAAMLGKSSLLDNFLKRDSLSKGYGRIELRKSWLFFFVFSVNLFFIPSQYMASYYIEGYSMKLDEQIMLNTAALLILYSKPHLADLYFYLKQKIVVYLTLTLCFLFSYLLIILDSSGDQASMIRLGLCLTYFLLTARYAKKLRS